MAAPHDSADLILKLYDLRREPRMREARQWFIAFNPDSVDDMLATLRGPNSAHFRMVATYWDMACSLVLHGAIDEAMFNDANGEHVAIFSKFEHLLPEYREKTGLPHYMKSLEAVCLRLPNAKERLKATRERLRAMAAARPAGN